MGTPPRTPTDKRKLPAAIVAARASAHPTAIALQGGDARKRFTDTMKEEVLLKVASGMSVKQCAEELGISPGAIYQRRYKDPAFAEELDAAYNGRTFCLKDSVLEVAMNQQYTAAERKVIVEALIWTAKVDNRARFGDQVKIDAVHSVPTVVLPTIALPSIADAEFDEVEPDEIEPDDEPQG